MTQRQEKLDEKDLFELIAFFLRAMFHLPWGVFRALVTAIRIGNPFYGLLLVISLAFVLTALAYAVVPVLEQKAREAGEEPPPSPFRDSLREDGWRWLLFEVSAMVIVGLLSMGLDRWRRYQQEHIRPGDSESHQSSGSP